MTFYFKWIFKFYNLNISTIDLRKLQIGRKIKRLRELKNLTQHQVAEKIGITQGAYSKIEMGESEVSYNRLETISEAFGMLALLRFYSTLQIFKSSL